MVVVVTPKLKGFPFFIPYRVRDHVIMGKGQIIDPKYKGGIYVIAKRIAIQKAKASAGTVSTVLTYNSSAERRSSPMSARDTLIVTFVAVKISDYQRVGGFLRWRYFGDLGNTWNTLLDIFNFFYFFYV